MAQELRQFYSEDYIKHIDACLMDEVGMSAGKFASLALDKGWGEMTLKERMYRLTDALHACLPQDYPKAIAVLKAVLPRITEGTYKYEDMLAMFVPEYVALYGLGHWEVSMMALEYFTSHGTTSEFGIRPFIMANQQRAMRRMLYWADHPHAHVRRFASEGCRPRLPWAMSLPSLKKEPQEIFPILERLLKDESRFVQKSVANNLNDIAKDHPERVIAFATKWKGTHPITDWILKHGCRTLLKRGNAETLALFGVKEVALEKGSLQLSARELAFGDTVHFSYEGKIASDLPEKLRFEYALHFVKANGTTSRKVFKLSESAPEHQTLAFSGKYTFADYTTRKHYPGEHRLEIIINGKPVAFEDFTVREAS
jgi:3-methyladenine DNA glycosylase AlkC